MTLSFSYYGCREYRTGLDRVFKTRCEYVPVRSLRPSLDATLRAAVAVQIVCPDDLLPSAVPADDSLDKSAGSRFGRPKDARRGYAMDGVNQNPIQSCCLQRL